jgi:hypothetical protein
MTEPLEETARRIADKGRDALVERLRPAFAEAAAAHADVLDLDAEALERMVQDAADRADGLQWRRALAAAATEELGIGLAEALGHPAVARAQELVGAPSYEDSLAAIRAEAASPASSVEGVVAEGEPEAVDAGAHAGAGAGEPVRAAEEMDEAVAGEPAAAAPETNEALAAELGAIADELEAAAAEPEAGAANGVLIQVPVVHLNGLATAARESELELRFSEAGLDVVPVGGEGTVAHFAWSEIRELEVQPGRGGVLRRRGAGARLTLSAIDRRARFEARGADAAELKRRLAPALAKLDERQ